jgi:hypothetical protein
MHFIKESYDDAVTKNNSRINQVLKVFINK